MSFEEFDKYILGLPEVWLDYPFGEGVAVYKVGQEDGKIVALVNQTASPLRVSLKCDPLLAKNLREKYETVLPGHNLNKKYWNTIICSGQLSRDEIFDLARLSYELAIQEKA